MLNPKSVYSVLAPMFYTFKIFGLAPFKITNECYQKSKINLSWSLIFMSSTFIYNMNSLCNKGIAATSFLTAIPDLVSSSLSPISMFLYVLFGCIFHNKIINALQDINTFDKEMSDFLCLNLNQEYKKSKNYVILGLLGVLSYTMLLFSISLMIMEEIISILELQNFFLFTMPMIVNAFVNVQFSAIILCLKQRFRWLNQRIATISKESQMGKEITPLNESKNISLIFEKIRVNHNILCMISKELNKCYSVQLLFIVIRSFVTLITGLFYCGRFLIFHVVFSTEYALYNIVQLTLAMMELIVVAVACSSTSSEAHKTGGLVHNTMKFSKECKKEMKLQISFFSLQLLHQNVKFTACKLFVINEHLLLTIVAAISTYLVLVIQFQIQDYKLWIAARNLTEA